VVEWQRLRAGDGRLGEYETFLPGVRTGPACRFCAKRAKTAVARSDDPARVIAWFNAGLPETGKGAIAYVRALLAAGRAADAETEAMRAWSTLSFAAEEEQVLIDLAPEAVGFVDELRLDNLLCGRAGRRKPSGC
jgi:soluble lytic murein transglycosylase